MTNFGAREALGMLIPFSYLSLPTEAPGNSRAPFYYEEKYDKL